MESAADPFPYRTHPYPDTLYITNSLTPWSRVRLEKLTVSQFVKKSPVFYGTRRFISFFTSARHLSLSRAKSIQSMFPPIPLPEDAYYYITHIILSSHLGLGLLGGSFRQVSSPKPCIHLYCPPYMLHAAPTSFFSI